MEKHTPTPWVTNENCAIWPASDDDICIAEVRSQTDAAFIVEACNNYESLKKKYEELLKLIESESKGLCIHCNAALTSQEAQKHHHTETK